MQGRVWPCTALNLFDLLPMKNIALIAVLLGAASPLLADDRLRTFHSLKLAKAGVQVPLSLPALARYGQVNVTPSGGVQTSLRPILAYDSNLNGGVPHETVDINGLTFTVLEKDRAVSGLEAGLAGTLNGQYLIARGHRLSGYVAARYEHALSHDISHTELKANACYHYDSPKWSFAEACVSVGKTRGARSTSRMRSMRLNWGKVIDAGRFPFSLQAGLSRTHEDDVSYDQLHLTYKTNTDRMTFEAGAATQLRATGFAVDHSVYLSATRPVFNRPVSATLRLSRASGGTFLGLPRREDKAAVSLSVPVAKKVSLDLSYSHTASNLAYFRKRELGVNFVWRRF